ncbi:MAG TPA: phasin family protein [Thermoanaerobaculia bacterium]|jgi:poly(hydroxyalkanoate) granule-associated protein|nr:phasin family protein [Thermoanaerobaculia bacterium]
MATAPVRTQVKKQLDDVTSEVSKSAHQVFLAGLGAAALSQQEGGRFFDRLVTRGRKVEAEGKKKVTRTTNQGRKQLDAAKKRATQAFDRVQGELDSRLGKVANRLGIPSQDQIRLLTDRVAELTRKVEGLQRAAR